MIENIRKLIPDVSIRTAFIVGYPGETEEHFEHLCEFVRDMKFDRMGVFIYSREKGTPSYNMKPQVSKKIAKQRWKKLMEIQQEISKERNQRFVGKLLKFLLNPIPFKKASTDFTILRTCRQVASEGGSIAIFPEGNRTYSGKTEYIKPSTIKMMKFLNGGLA